MRLHEATGEVPTLVTSVTLVAAIAPPGDIGRSALAGPRLLRNDFGVNGDGEAGGHEIMAVGSSTSTRNTDVQAPPASRPSSS